jgi:hypothetical protein
MIFPVFFMGLSQFYILGCGLIKLIPVDSRFFSMLFLIDSFSSFTFHYLVCYKFDFCSFIRFILYRVMPASQVIYKFGMLIKVTFLSFLKINFFVFSFSFNVWLAGDWALDFFHFFMRLSRSHSNFVLLLNKIIEIF